MKFAICPSVVALALVGAADAADLHVPAQYPTIQAAVDAAVTGDVVLVAPGEWAGFSVANKGIVVRSTAGFAVTRIVSACSVSASTVPIRIENCSLINSTLSVNSVPIELVGVRALAGFCILDGSAAVHASHSEFTAFDFRGGGSGSAHHFSDCSFRSTPSAIFLNCSSLELLRTNFTGCSRAVLVTGSAVITSCTFSGSSIMAPGSSVQGGFVNAATVNATNCNFANSSLSARISRGGALYSVGAMSVSGCAFTDCAVNSIDSIVGGAQGGGGAISADGSILIGWSTFSNCCARGTGVNVSYGSGSAEGFGYGGAVLSSSLSLNVADCVFTQCRAIGRAEGANCGFSNIAGLYGFGGAIANKGTATVLRSRFVQCSNAGETSGCWNTNVSGEGGAVWSRGTSVTIEGCDFLANSVGPVGGAGGAISAFELELSNSVFRDNIAPIGGAIYVPAAGAAMISDAFVRMSFFSQNDAANVGGGDDLATATSGGTALLFLADCSFCSTAQNACAGNWFQKGGNQFGVDCESDCDADGLPNAYELNAGLETDCNGNGIPDNCDADSGGSDCNNNGIPDLCDVVSGTAADCNTNGVPDSCEPDCDSDGIPNACAIAAGTPDCNLDGVPDTCQADCDDDGVINACEIAKGSSDCNANGIPDSCEIESGAASDFNRDDVIDACQPDMQFAGLELEIVPIINRGTDDLFPASAVCYRLYAKTTQPSAAVLGMFGNPAHPLSLMATGGFWQSPAGGDLASSIPCDLSAVLPSARYDSWFTVGLSCATGNSAQNTGLDLTAFNAGGGVADDDGIVFVAPIATQSIAGASKRVLLAQLTTASTVLPSGLVDIVGLPATGDGEWVAFSQVIPAPALVDCNGNGQHDAFDIALGTLRDCDQSGVPDICEFPSASTDCNLNGIPDLCDVVSAFSSDLNTNFVPDECECSGDVDGNGRVDVDDIIDVITSWGESGASAADVNSDGIVDAADLVIVLTGYGSCN